MKRSLTLTAVLIAALFVAACGGSEPGQSGEAAPPEPRQTQAEPAPESTPEEAAPVETEAPEETEAAEEAQSGESGEEVNGPSVTTIQGEEVSLGGQGEVTALFFMAGW